MRPVVVTIPAAPAPFTVPDDEFDAETFTPEFIPDVDALAESTKCSCSAGDDNPY